MIGRRVWLQAIAGASLQALTGCEPSEKETVMASQLVKNMTTHAVGRHLIDMPSNFAMEGGSVVLTYGLDRDFTTVEVVVESFEATPASFAKFLRDRKIEISSQTHDKLPNTSMLVEAIELSPSAVLLRRYDNSLMTDAFRTELIAVVGTVLVTAWQDSYEGNFAPATQRLTRVASQLSAPDADVVGGKGFRIGKLLIAADHDQEDGNVFFRSKAATAVLVKVLVNAIAPNPSPSLIPRWNGASWVETTMGRKPKVARSGQIKLGDMQGEELLTKADMDGRFVMKLWAESKRPKREFATPLLTIQLDTEPNTAADKEAPAPWNELDTTTVWDAIVKSVRPRPSAV